MTTTCKENFLWRLLKSSPLNERRQATKWHRSRRKPSTSLTTITSIQMERDLDSKEQQFGFEETNCDTGRGVSFSGKRSRESGARVLGSGGSYLLNLHSLLSSMALLLILLISVDLVRVEAKLVINVINTNGLSASPSPQGTNSQRLKRSALQIQANATTGRPANEPQQRQVSPMRSAKLHAAEVDAISYLERFGYMNKSSLVPNANLISEDSFENAIMSFQRFAGIPETGTIDSMTVKYMQMPRCGNKDQSGKGENGRRRKRYALQGSKWRRQELSYRISQYPTRLAHKKSDVDGQIEKAFKIWSQVAPIDFVVKKEGRVHIDIRFASGEHGDGDPFDGPGNTLAHAYFPQYGGDAHFDDQEYWTVDSYAGTNIFQVAAHELGHSLGLGHSSVREALMAPFYQKYKPNFKLHADDILAIQALYGERDDSSAGSGGTTNKPSTSTSTSTTTTTVSSRDDSNEHDDDDDDTGGGFFGFGAAGGKPVDLCQDSKIDAITRTEDGNTYVFRGQHYWQIKNEGLANGGSASKISRDWNGLPGNLDAALTWSDGKTFFFKGDKYWRFFNKRREPGYPKLISAGFAGIPNNVDAAFVWSGNGKTYFFKRDKYWRFDSKQEPPVSSQYPKSIKNWSGLPTSGIDGAFKWDNGMTYFFKEDLYYRFDDREFEVDTSARPSFPRSTAEWWFGCTNSNLPLVASSSGSARPRKSQDEEEEQDSKALMFHRKPSLLFSGDQLESSSSSQDFSATDKPKPAGSSISRSILTSLSGLFSSGSSLDSRDRDSDDRAKSIRFADDDWSFHRGISEEFRRNLNKPKPASQADNSLEARPKASIFETSSNLNKAKRASGSASSPDNSRWLFPLSSSLSSSHQIHFSNGEQSLSELRMEPTSATNLLSSPENQRETTTTT